MDGETVRKREALFVLLHFCKIGAARLGLPRCAGKLTGGVRTGLAAAAAAAAVLRWC